MGPKTYPQMQGLRGRLKVEKRLNIGFQPVPVIEIGLEHSPQEELAMESLGRQLASKVAIQNLQNAVDDDNFLDTLIPAVGYVFGQWLGSS